MEAVREWAKQTGDLEWKSLAYKAEAVVDRIMFYTAGVSRFIAEAHDTGEVVGLPSRFILALESDGALRHLV